MKCYFIIGLIILCSANMKEKEHRLGSLPLKEFYTYSDEESFVLLLTGDGGWKKLVSSVANNFVRHNIPVVGLNSRSYFQDEKTPEILASDIQNIIELYAEKWDKKSVIIVGYSFGADVIPFALEGYKNFNVKKLILISPYIKAHFKIRLSDYLFGPSHGSAVLTQLQKINKKDVFIICDDDKNGLCRVFQDQEWNYTYLGGGHHFNEEYNKLNQLINENLGIK